MSTRSVWDDHVWKYVRGIYYYYMLGNELSDGKRKRHA